MIAERNLHRREKININVCGVNVSSPSALIPKKRMLA